MLRHFLATGSTAAAMSGAAAAALSFAMPEHKPPTMLLDAAASRFGARPYVDTFSTSVGQRSAREKLADCDADGLARLLFECTIFAPEALVLRKSRGNGIESTPPWRFEVGAQYLLWQCEAANEHSVLLRNRSSGRLSLVIKDDEHHTLSLGTAMDPQLDAVSIAAHRFYSRLLVLSMASLLVRRRMGSARAGNNET